MKKNGFTLIEIIICIGLIVIIGGGSFVGIRLVDKKILKDKLEQITDQAILAAQVYIETNKQVSEQLYKQKNGVSLPLQLLVNEGLLDVSNTKLDDNDLKDQYVITFLGATGSNGSDNCEQITSTTSWGNDKEIYLCMQSNGSSNLATIDPNKYSNKTKAMQEPYYFRGAGARNYVKYNNNIYRIIYIDTDDTLVLYSENSFGNTFKGKTLPISRYNVSRRASFSYSKLVWCGSVDNNPRIGEQTLNREYDIIDGETTITTFDVIKTSYCVTNGSHVNALDAWMNFSWESYVNSSTNGYYINLFRSPKYKIHLDSSFKLGDGTGDYANPYELVEK